MGDMDGHQGQFMEEVSGNLLPVYICMFSSSNKLKKYVEV
jgi:hypothetical protein